jgi:hypothetical protein
VPFKPWQVGLDSIFRNYLDRFNDAVSTWNTYRHSKRILSLPSRLVICGSAVAANVGDEQLERAALALVEFEESH